MQGGRQARAVDDQRQMDTGVVPQLEKCPQPAVGQAVGAQDRQTGDRQSVDPGGRGLPDRLAARGETAGELWRLTQRGQQVVGESGIAGRARSRMEGDPACRGVMGGQRAVRVGGIIGAVEDHSQPGQ